MWAMNYKFELTSLEFCRLEFWKHGTSSEKTNEIKFIHSQWPESYSRSYFHDSVQCRTILNMMAAFNRHSTDSTVIQPNPQALRDVGKKRRRRRSWYKVSQQPSCKVTPDRRLLQSLLPKHQSKLILSWSGKTSFTFTFTTLICIRDLQN